MLIIIIIIDRHLNMDSNIEYTLTAKRSEICMHVWLLLNNTSTRNQINYQTEYYNITNSQLLNY